MLALTPRQKAKALRQGPWSERRYGRTPLDLILRQNPLAEEHGLFNLAGQCRRKAMRYGRGDGGVMRASELEWARAYLAESVAIRTGSYPFGSTKLYGNPYKVLDLRSPCECARKGGARG